MGLMITVVFNETAKEKLNNGSPWGCYNRQAPRFAGRYDFPILLRIRLFYW
jgi:hypothetical protein